MVRSAEEAYTNNAEELGIIAISQRVACTRMKNMMPNYVVANGRCLTTRNQLLQQRIDIMAVGRRSVGVFDMGSAEILHCLES